MHNRREPFVVDSQNKLGSSHWPGALGNYNNGDQGDHGDGDNDNCGDGDHGDLVKMATVTMVIKVFIVIMVIVAIRQLFSDDKQNMSFWIRKYSYYVFIWYSSTILDTHLIFQQCLAQKI